MTIERLKELNEDLLTPLIHRKYYVVFAERCPECGGNLIYNKRVECSGLHCNYGQRCIDWLQGEGAEHE